MGRPAPASNHIPRGARTVTLEEWTGYLRRTSTINADGNPREEFRRIKDGLREKRVIGIWDGLVWDARSQPTN